MSIKNKIYHCLEAVMFSLSLASASLSLYDLKLAAEKAQEVYLKSKGTITKENKNKFKGLNQAKRFSAYEGLTALGFLGIGSIARSRRKGKSSFGILEASCLTGALSISYFLVATPPYIGDRTPDQIRKNLVNVRNGLVIKGVIPRQSGVTYTLEDKQNANEILKIKSPYIALELLAMSALMYGTTRKK